MRGRTMPRLSNLRCLIQTQSIILHTQYSEYVGANLRSARPSFTQGIIIPIVPGAWGTGVVLGVNLLWSGAQRKSHATHTGSLEYTPQNRMCWYTSQHIQSGHSDPNRSGLPIPSAAFACRDHNLQPFYSGLHWAINEGWNRLVGLVAQTLERQSNANPHKTVSMPSNTCLGYER